MNNLIGAFLVLIGAICFSAKAVLVKLTYLHDVDTITILTLRMLFALPFYLVILFLNRKRLKSASVLMTKRDWINVIVMGVIGYYLASIFDFIGLKYITAGLERLILFVYPTLVVILSAVFLKKKIGFTEYLALALTYLGIAVVFLDGAIVTQNNLWLGSSYIFAGALAYAFYLVGTGEISPKLGSINYTALSMLVSTFAVFIHYLLVQKTFNIFTDVKVLWLTFYMGIFATVIPTFLIAEGIRRIGAGRASIIASIGPISTII